MRFFSRCQFLPWDNTPKEMETPQARTIRAPCKAIKSKGGVTLDVFPNQWCKYVYARLDVDYVFIPDTRLTLLMPAFVLW